MHLFAEAVFYGWARERLPTAGYRPDAIFDGAKEYRGVTFTDLPVERFDEPTPVTIRFTFQESHYQEVAPGQTFRIMEGPHQVGEGWIVSIEH